MSRLKPTTLNQLKRTIKEEIEKYGLNCNLNHIDTSLITDMTRLFQDKSAVYGIFKPIPLNKFNGDISKWDTSNVRDMKCMFADSIFNQDISRWNTSKVSNMSRMFSKSKFNQDISLWDTSNVTDMSEMFFESEFNQDISSWDTSKVANTRFMFSGSEFSGDISKWNLNNLKSLDKYSSYRMFMNSPLELNVAYKTL